MSPFLPHSDAPTNGAFSATSARVALPRTGGSVAVRISWESGAGWIKLGDNSATVSATDGIRLPSTAGVEIMRLPPTATHLAYMGCAVNLVAGDGV